MTAQTVGIEVGQPIALTARQVRKRLHEAVYANPTIIRKSYGSKTLFVQDYLLHLSAIDATSNLLLTAGPSRT